MMEPKLEPAVPATASPAPPPETDARPTGVQELPCTWHPDRLTGLRCIRCDRPICPKCARAAPVGWRCIDCAKQLRSPLYKVSPRDAIAAALAAAAISALTSIIIRMLPLGLFINILAGLFAGGLMADAASAAGGRKHGRVMQAATVAGIVGGALAVALGYGFLGGPPAWANAVPSLAVMAVAACVTAVGRLR